MIYTLTMNPSIDYYADVDDFELAAVNRTKNEAFFPGGKGLNVSMVLNNLGIKNKALFFAGGFTGDELCRCLKEKNVDFVCFPVSDGITRINVKINSGKETELNGMGPLLKEENKDKLINVLRTLGSGDYLVLSGSVPCGVGKDIYAGLCSMVRPLGVKVFVDASGELLLKALPEKPFFIKPNVSEAEEILGVEIKSVEDAFECAKKLRSMGALNVCISMGAEGAVLVSEDGNRIHVPSRKGEVISTVGSGDSLLAGFLAGISKKDSYEAALRLGVAAGCANAFSRGLPEGKDIYANICEQ